MQTLDWLKPENWWYLKLHLNANQSKNGPQADHTLLPEHCELLTVQFQGGLHSL